VHNGANLEMLRNYFLERLVNYKRQKQNKITVIFDAYKSISLTRQRENYKGIEVIYTKENETADELIMQWIRTKPAGMVVVTSDRAIIDEAKKYGIAFITPAKMEDLIMGCEIEDEEDEASRTTKKGNPRKLPKKLRKVTRVISKIKV